MSLEQQIEDYVNHALSTTYSGCLTKGGDYEKNSCEGFSDAETYKAREGYTTRVDLSGDHFKIFTRKKPFTIKSNVTIEDGSLSAKNLVVDNFVINKNRISYADASDSGDYINLMFDLSFHDAQWQIEQSINRVMSIPWYDIPQVSGYNSEFQRVYTYRQIFGFYFEGDSNNENPAVASGNLTNVKRYYDNKSTSYTSAIKSHLTSKGNTEANLCYYKDGKESDYYCGVYFGQPDPKGFQEVEGFNLRLPLKLLFPSESGVSELSSVIRTKGYTISTNLDDLNNYYLLEISRDLNTNIHFKLSYEYDNSTIAEWDSDWDYSKNEPRWPLNLPNFNLSLVPYFYIEYHTEAMDLSKLNSASEIAFNGDVRSLENTYQNLQRAVQKSENILSCFEVSDDQIGSLINKTLYQ